MTYHAEERTNVRGALCADFGRALSAVFMQHSYALGYETALKTKEVSGNGRGLREGTYRWDRDLGSRPRLRSRGGSRFLRTTRCGRLSTAGSASTTTAAPSSAGARGRRLVVGIVRLLLLDLGVGRFGLYAFARRPLYSGAGFFFLTRRRNEERCLRYRSRLAFCPRTRGGGLFSFLSLGSGPPPKRARLRSRGRRRVTIVVFLQLGNGFSEVRGVEELANSPQPPWWPSKWSATGRWREEASPRSWATLEPLGRALVRS